MSSSFNLYGIPVEIKSDKGGAFVYKEDKDNFAKAEILKYNTAHPECRLETEL